MLTAAYGVTAMQALIARPNDFTPAKTCLIDTYIYGGPQLFWAPV